MLVRWQSLPAIFRIRAAYASNAIAPHLVRGDEVRARSLEQAAGDAGGHLAHLPEHLYTVTGENCGIGDRGTTDNAHVTLTRRNCVPPPEKIHRAPRPRIAERHSAPRRSVWR